MNRVVDRLREAYLRELDLYVEVEGLGHAGVRAVRERLPLHRLNEINRQKQDRLNRIAEIEMGIAADKDAWRRTRDDRPFAHALDPVLEQLRRRIESILEIERETEKSIVEASGLLESEAAKS